MGLGDGWTEGLVVRITGLGDITGDASCEWEAALKALIADSGTFEG
jgi:hypothetical protein